MFDWWFFAHEEKIYGYYLIAPEAKTPVKDQVIACAVSQDLINWDYQGIVLRNGKAGAWDSKNLATGSIIRHNNKFYMAFTGHKLQEALPVERTGLAESDDLIHWKKLPSFKTEPDSRYYEIKTSGKRDLVHWRDPFLFKHDDYIYQAVCARKKNGPVDGRGTIGLSRCKDLMNWEILPPPEVDEFAEELECPQIYHINNKYYLLFSTHRDLVSVKYKKQFPAYDFSSSTRCMVADSPLGPFHIHGTGEILPKNGNKTIYAAQLVYFKNEWYFMGTVWGEPARLSDPIPVTFAKTGVKVVL